MVVLYYGRGHDKDDPSFDEIDHHHPPAQINISSDAWLGGVSGISRYLQRNPNPPPDDDDDVDDRRRGEVIIFEALLVVRAVLFPRNVFLIRGMKSKRRKLKVAFRRCILGNSFCWVVMMG